MLPQAFAKCNSLPPAGPEEIFGAAEGKGPGAKNAPEPAKNEKNFKFIPVFVMLLYAARDRMDP